MIPWTYLDQTSTVAEMEALSHRQPVVLFKHSTRCSVSAMALDRLERAWEDQKMTPVAPLFLDLIRYRELSNAIAEKFGVAHESPQVIVIKEGRCIYNTSHLGIRYSDLKAQI
jgi:bacillithiol system protein YtxJ